MQWVSVLNIIIISALLAFVNGAPFPLESAVQTAINNVIAAPKPVPTGFSKNDYLQTFSGITGYFRTIQLPNGLIQDPILGREIQYATPTFAHAAIVQSVVTGDTALLQSGLAALNNSLGRLVGGGCPDGHCNFFMLPVMNAIEAARPVISVSLFQYYLTQAARINTNIYTENGINWGIVAASGEAVRNFYGLVGTTYIENILGDHIRLMSNDGLYMDPTPASNPSTAYDLFPRLFLEYMEYRGYNGSKFSPFPELLNRSSLVSLLLQSPQGEWPTGGRSSNHQWNEAAMCALFELRATFHKARGDMVLASAFKRAAHLSLKSFKRWVTETGYAFVVKNRFPPSRRWGYETYSHLTNYNGLPASMLAMAYEVADESIPEGPSFAETGGYVFEVPSHHKIIANVKGNYLEFEAQADPAYDCTGLSRIHHPEIPALIGPSSAAYPIPNAASAFAIGVAWTKGNVTQSLAQFGTRSIASTTLGNVNASPSSVSFTITYAINGSSIVNQVVEAVTVTSHEIKISTSIQGDVDSVTLKYPIFLFDGTYNYSYSLSGSTATVYGGVDQSYTVTKPTGATLQFTDSGLTSRNGYVGIASTTVTAVSGSTYDVVIKQCPGCLSPQTFRVGSSSSAQHATINAAVQAAKAANRPYVIEIEAGTYNEQVLIDTPNGIIRPISTAAANSVIVSSSPTTPSGAVISVTANRVKIYDIVALKTSTEAANAGAVLKISSSDVSVYRSRFLGFGTIVLLGRGNSYFAGSYFEGGADLVSGSGIAYFDTCSFASNTAGAVASHFGVANNTNDKWIFNNVELFSTAPSQLISSYATPSRPALTDGMTYLGRAGDSFARISYFFSGFSTNVAPSAWQSTGKFLELQNDGARGAFSTSRAASAELITGEQSRPYGIELLLGNAITAPAWVDETLAPSCGGAYAQCGGANFAGKTCCKAPFSCIARDHTFSQCTAVPLSARGNGQVTIASTGTIGLATIYAYNPFGFVNVSYSNSGVFASFNAIYSNAVTESISSLTSTLRGSNPQFNISVAYSPLSDLRGVAINLRVILPLNSKIVVVPTTSPVVPTSSPSSPPTIPPISSESAAHQDALLSFVAVVVAVFALFL